MKQYMEAFLKAARDAGIDQVQFHSERLESRSVHLYQGEIDQVQISSRQTYHIKGAVDGFAGSAFVEDLRQDLFGDVIAAIKQSALAGGQTFLPWQLPNLSSPQEESEPLPLPDIKELLLQTESAAYGFDQRITQVQNCVYGDWKKMVTLADSDGNQAEDLESGGHCYVAVTARQGEKAQLGSRSVSFPWRQIPDVTTLARHAAAGAVNRLNAESYATGFTPVVIDCKVVGELLDAFMPAFFGENVCSGMSVLRESEGQKIAGENITLREVPSLQGGLSRRRFDDEGILTTQKDIISRGRLTNFLYDRRFAAMAGKTPGGNGFRPGTDSEIGTGFTNLILEPGEKNQNELIAEMGEGLLITSVDGVFAGAQFSSGDFSLISHGYRIQEGKPGRAVSQITIAGNFFQMLGQVREVGSDLRWFSGSYGQILAPSLSIERLAVSGNSK